MSFCDEVLEYIPSIGPTHLHCTGGDGSGWAKAMGVGIMDFVKGLDTIIAYQFTIAWAGEALSQPARLKWWRTDLVDEYGGGDLMLRVAPRTHKWAALEAAREAAVLADRKARQRLANSDSARSLFFWGFEIDEKLGERIRDLKWAGKSPQESLPLPCELGSDFDRDEFAKTLEALAPATPFEVQASGREIKGTMPDDLSEAAKLLMGAFLPLADEYPLPFFRV